MLNFFASFFTNDKTFLDAVKGGNVGFVRRLLAAGANPNAADKDGDTALVVAVKANHAEVVKTLLDGGAKPHYGNDGLSHPRPGGNSSPALLEAVREQRVKISEMLLDAGADADSDYDGSAGKKGANWTVLKEATSADNADIVDILLAHGADTNIDEYSDDEFISPLYLAVKRGNADIAERLLDAGADPNKMGAYGAMYEHGIPLFCAVSDNNFEMGKLLLRFGADPHADQYSAWTLWDSLGCLDDDDPNLRAWKKMLLSEKEVVAELVSAASGGKVDEVRWLIAEDIDFSTPDKSGQSYMTQALCAAADGGQADTVKVLLDAGANLNEADMADRTALKFAVSGGHDEVVKLLLDGGADPDATDGDNWTALMFAAATTRCDEIGRSKVAKLLLDSGADMDKMDGSGQTALMVAAAACHIEIVKLLLDSGADPRATDEDGNTALDCAKRSKCSDAEYFLESALAPPIRQEYRKKGEWFYAVHVGDTKEIHRLLDEGADVNAVDWDGNTALMSLARQDSTVMIISLLRSGANANYVAPNEMTALMIAAQSGNYGSVKNLLEEGNIEDLELEGGSGGNTALMFAAEAGCVESVKALLQAGADVNMSSVGGLTPLIKAAGRGHAKVVEILLTAGANPNFIEFGNTALNFAKEEGHDAVVKMLLDGGADPFAGKDDVGFVYLAINESMPGLVKIGMTKVDVDERIKELSRTTSVPTPFECAYSVKVVSPKQVEESLHEKYDFCRVRGEREFFKIDWRAVKLYLEEITK